MSAIWGRDERRRQAVYVIDAGTPLSVIGVHTAQNVLPACKPCNNHKQNRTLAEWLTSATFPERARARVEALLLRGTA